MNTKINASIKGMDYFFDRGIQKFIGVKVYGIVNPFWKSVSAVLGKALISLMMSFALEPGV